MISVTIIVAVTFSRNSPPLQCVLKVFKLGSSAFNNGKNGTIDALQKNEGEKDSRQQN